MHAIETIITLKSLRNSVYAIGGLSFCCDNKSVVEGQCKAIDEAIAAVEKTIPQKVKRDPFGVECPNCGGRVVLPSTYTFSSKFNNNMIDVQTFNNNRIGIRCDCCYSCGQALDWSEE